jgi:flagellar basal-body rod protein FlgC
MNEFDVLGSAAAGMDAQRAALDVAARNVAAAEAAPDGGVFTRLVPQFRVAPLPEASADGFELGESSDDLPDESPDETGDVPVRFSGTTAERGAGVDAVTEMVAVLDAQRAYEANASVFDLGKRLAERTIDLGRL